MIVVILAVGLADEAAAGTERPVALSQTLARAGIRDGYTVSRSSLSASAQATIAAIRGALPLTMCVGMLVKYENDRYLDTATQGGGVNGNKVQLYHCIGGYNQQWIVVEDPDVG